MSSTLCENQHMEYLENQCSYRCYLTSATAMLKATLIATQFNRYFVTWAATRAVTSVAVVSTSSMNCSSSFSCRLALPATTSTPPLTTSRSSRRRRFTEPCGAAAVRRTTAAIGREAATATTIWRSNTTPALTFPTSWCCGVAPGRHPSPTPVAGSTADRAAPRRPRCSTFRDSTTTTTTETSSPFTRFHATSSWRRRSLLDRSTTAHPPGLHHVTFTGSVKPLVTERKLCIRLFRWPRPLAAV